MNAVGKWIDSPVGSHALVSKLPKSSDDYLRSLGKYWWLVLLLTASIGAGGTWFTLHQSPVYFASARVLIEPPRAIVPELVGDKGSPVSVNFFNTRLQLIMSREISQRVLASRELAEWKELRGIKDPLSVISGWVEAKPVQNSNLVDVMLEGTDPEATAKVVNLVVDEFINYEKAALLEYEQQSRQKLDGEAKVFENLKDQASKELTTFHNEHDNFNSTGVSEEAARLADLEMERARAELKAAEAQRAVERFQSLINAGIPWFSPGTISKAEEIKSRLARIDAELATQKELLKPDYFEADTAIRRLRAERDKLAMSLGGTGRDDAEFELKRLKQDYQFAAMDLDKINAAVEKQRDAVQAQRGDQQRLDQLRASNDRIHSLHDFISRSKLQIDMHQSLITPRIQVIDDAVTPTSPVRPIKEIQIPLFFVGGLALGVLLAVGIEFLNQRVRRVEQARVVLGWPMIGVIPRLARRERLGRRGCLTLASEQPASRICETFRNLRVGLLGVEAGQTSRSLVVSSPTTGEGKSLVAANLAATCARAGESVLLVDIDLRHPRLAKELNLGRDTTGLVETVLGQCTWQEAVQETEVPNLYALPAGRTAGVPTDILGTVEMHDLLSELCEEFDRVIIDGPPLVGLADARVVGRFADALILVVAANKHNAAPLGRVRELCDMEGIQPLGFVFNGIRYKHEDFRAVRMAVAKSRLQRASSNVRLPIPEKSEEGVIETVELESA